MEGNLYSSVGGIARLLLVPVNKFPIRYASMNTVLRTTADDLARIARERGREYDADRHAAWCGHCGVPLGPFGILHWPDCAGDEAEIRFRDVE